MVIARTVEKKSLSARGLLEIVRRAFNKVKDPRKSSPTNPIISIADCLMSALAMFGLKFPSLLQFDQKKEEETIRHNLQTLYGVDKAPSDTYMRERLDEIEPEEIRGAFKGVFTAIQRGNLLESYQYLHGYYLLLVDGTGTFSSGKIHCENCCEKHHKDGKVSYYHQMLAGVIAHPDHRAVFPVCPEAISKQDGNEKNDCERNAGIRFFEHFRREHPHLKTIVVSDALSSNGPFIRRLEGLNMRYILSVKHDGNKSLFEWIQGLHLESQEFKDKEGNLYQMRWINQIPLNDSHRDIEVNFFDCKITTQKGEKNYFSWCTDIEVTPHNVWMLVRAGRARWKVENETFNTLKNQDYQYERNYGHGEKHLCHVFALLMFLAFLIDQVQEQACGLFRAALKKVKSRIVLWEDMRSLFKHYFILSWEELFASIAHGFRSHILVPNTS